MWNDTGPVKCSQALIIEVTAGWWVSPNFSLLLSVAAADIRTSLRSINLLDPALRALSAGQCGAFP